MRGGDGGGGGGGGGARAHGTDLHQTNGDEVLKVFTIFGLIWQFRRVRTGDEQQRLQRSAAPGDGS